MPKPLIASTAKQAAKQRKRLRQLNRAWTVKEKRGSELFYKSIIGTWVPRPVRVRRGK